VAAELDQTIDANWSRTRARVLEVLQRDAELREVAAIVGPEALEDQDRLLLAVAAALREFVLGQNAFDPDDAVSAPGKTLALAACALGALDSGREALARGGSFADTGVDRLRQSLAALRDAPREAAP
jgi:V/A-type H+-transporting ATPase subunit A